MPLPIYLVTEYRNVRQRSKASEYSGTDERTDLFKVKLIHGYYAGMGMNFFFPTEADASRFSLHTIYTPDEIIERMDDGKFRVESIKKSGLMAAANKYTDAKVFYDAWKVFFTGEQDNFLETFHPWESIARSFKIGHAYTMKDLLGTTEGTTRDARFIMEQYAEQLAEDEAKKARERESALQAEAAYRAKLYFERTDPVARQAELLQQILDDYNKVGEGLSEREKWIAQFRTGGFSREQAEDAYEITMQIRIGEYVPPPPPTNPPPNQPPGGGTTLQERAFNAISADYFIGANGASAGWYSAAVHSVVRVGERWGDVLWDYKTSWVYLEEGTTGVTYPNGVYIEFRRSLPELNGAAFRGWFLRD